MAAGVDQRMSLAAVRARGAWLRGHSPSSSSSVGEALPWHTAMAAPRVGLRLRLLAGFTADIL